MSRKILAAAAAAALGVGTPLLTAPVAQAYCPPYVPAALCMGLPGNGGMPAMPGTGGVPAMPVAPPVAAPAPVIAPPVAPPVVAPPVLAAPAPVIAPPVIAPPVVSPPEVLAAAPVVPTAPIPGTPPLVEQYSPNLMPGLQNALANGTPPPAPAAPAPWNPTSPEGLAPPVHGVPLPPAPPVQEPGPVGPVTGPVPYYSAANCPGNFAQADGECAAPGAPSIQGGATPTPMPAFNPTPVNHDPLLPNYVPTENLNSSQAPPENVVYPGLIPDPYQQAPAPGWVDPLVSSPCNPINGSPTCVNTNAPTVYPGLIPQPDQMLGAPDALPGPSIPDAPPAPDAPPLPDPNAPAPPDPNAPPPPDPNAPAPDGPQACTQSSVFSTNPSRVVLVGCMNDLLFPDSPGGGSTPPPITPIIGPQPDIPLGTPVTSPSGGVPLRPPGIGGPGNQGGNIP